MARGMNSKTDTPPAPAGDNKGKEIRADAIRKVIKDLRALEAQRETISGKIRELKQTVIKGDLAMKMADFAFARRLYDLDTDDQQTFFGTLRETFDALGQGDQLGFLDALDKTEKQVGEGEDPTPERAEELGFQAGKRGDKLTEHPFKLPRQKTLRIRFETGWERGQAEKVHSELGGNAKTTEAAH